MPKQFIHKGENLDVVFKRQRFIIKLTGLKIDPSMFILLDDVLRDVNIIRYSKNLRTLFTDGRIFKLFTIVITQSAKGLPPTLRANCDCAVIFKQYSAS